MSKRKRHKEKLPKPAAPPLLGVGLLTAGVLIAVIGSMTVPSLLAESEDVRPVVVAFISLAIGVPMALLGMKYMRPPAKKK